MRRVASARVPVHAIELLLKCVIEKLVPVLPEKAEQLPNRVNRFISIFSCGNSATGGVQCSIIRTSSAHEITLYGALSIPYRKRSIS
jgi:hypothetical protein